MKSMEILGRLIADKTEDVEKLHDLGTYARRGLESATFDLMRTMWNA